MSKGKTAPLNASLVEVVVILVKEDETNARLQLELLRDSMKEEFLFRKMRIADKNDNGYADFPKRRFRKIPNRNLILGNEDALQYCLGQLLLRSPSSIRLSQDKPKRIIFGVIHPSKYEIDFISNNIQTMLVAEKIELEHSLNWLSTLGGAFSALGEKDEQFALKAGKVTKSQLYIAMRLGSPIIMSRCRLYAAISLIQLGKLRDARIILQREYKYAKAFLAEADPRILRMCYGIWCKLQYEWSQTKQLKKQSK